MIAVRIQSSVLIPIAALAACAASAPHDAPVAIQAAISQQAQPVEASAARSESPAAVHSASAGPSFANVDDLHLWNDPRFRRQFTESYLAETEIEPRVTAAERDQMQKVMELLTAEQLPKAAELLRGAQSPAASAVIDFTLANVHFQLEQFDEALAAYQVAVDKYPKFRRAWQNMGLIATRRNDFEGAARAFTRVLELGGGNATTYGLLGFAHANLNRQIAAESAYRMAALLDPATLDWKMQLARTFFKQERYADAATLCGQLIAENGDKHDLWMLQANAYLGMKQSLKAAENFEIVDKMGHSTADSLYLLGDIYVNEELYDLAAGAYLRGFAKKADTTVRAIRAAKVLATRSATEQARTLLDKIAATETSKLTSDERKDLLKLRARLAMADGASDEEARILEEIVTFDPLDGDALILLGQHSARHGAPEKAVFYYERAASIPTFEADAKIRHAQLLVGQRRYAEALPLLRRAQTVKPRENIQDYLEQVERAGQTR